MKTIYGLFVLLLILSYLSATDRPSIICHPDPVRATVGEDVALPCHLPDERDVTLNEFVWWKFNGSHNVVVYTSSGFTHKQHEQFKDRATIDRNGLDRGNLTVKISSVNTTDGGNYTCTFKGEDQPPVSCNVDLSVAVKGSSDKNTEEKPGPVDTHEDGKIPGGFIAGVVVLVLVVAAALVLAIVIRKRCKRPCFNPPEPVTAAVGENVTLDDGRDVTVDPAVPRNDEQEEPPQEGHRLLQLRGPNDANDGPATSCDAANSQNPAKLRDDEETETLEQQEKQTLLSETLIPTLRKRKESEEQSLSEHDPNQ